MSIITVRQFEVKFEGVAIERNLNASLMAPPLSRPYSPGASSDVLEHRVLRLCPLPYADFQASYSCSKFDHE